MANIVGLREKNDLPDNNNNSNKNNNNNNKLLQRIRRLWEKWEMEHEPEEKDSSYYR